MLRKLVWLTLIACSCLMALAQDSKTQEPALSGKDFSIKEVDVVEKDRALVPYADDASQADLSKVELVDLEGNKANPPLKGVTIIEFWSTRDKDNNLYWNMARELERKYADNPDVQIISINHDDVLSGKWHRASVKTFLENMTPPLQLYLDRLNGFRDVFRVPGSVSYMLIDHRGQFTHVGRGDDPDTIKLFEKFFPNAVKYMGMFSPDEKIMPPPN